MRELRKSERKNGERLKGYFKNDSKNIAKGTQNRRQKLDKDFEEKKIKNQYTATFKVNHSVELLEFLLVKCHTSRNNVKNLLSQHKVLVNGGCVSQFDFMLVKDDEVKLSKCAIKVESNKLRKNQESKKNVELPFEIIYQDENFVAIDKPAGLLSVESDEDRNSAFSYLLDYFQTKDKNSRPYILHRIDKETSGVLVFAKNPKIHSMLKLNWNDFVKTREYFAVVEGCMEKDDGTVTSYLKENVNHMVYSSFDKSGKKAITNYKVVSKNEKFSLLKVLIDSGRKNQIRVHMHDIKHPIVGDEKYGFTFNPLNRLGLHASKLEFLNPITKDLITITAKVPEKFFTVTK